MDNKPQTQATPEMKDKPKEFKTMEIVTQPQATAQPQAYQQTTNYYQQQYTHPLYLLINNILANESNKKFYQNEVMQVKMTKLEYYTDMSKIKLLFRSCEDANDDSFNWLKLNDAVFFVLRSTCDDDIHKAIKYGLWTSTHGTNTMLNDQFKACQRKGIPLYIIFT